MIKLIKCGGVQVKDLNLTAVGRKKSSNEPTIGKVVLLPFINNWVC